MCIVYVVERGNVMVISVKKLVKRYENYVAVDHLDLEVKEGEIFGILGPAGSGKSTLIYCMLSLITYDKGSIKLFGEAMSPTQEALKKKIGVCFQEEAFFETLSVFDNLYYFTNLYLKDKERAEEAVHKVLRFLEMEDKRKMFPSKLDEGNRKLLDLACGLAHMPKLLIIDGGIGNVEPKVKNKIFEKIRELKRRGTTILYTTHSIDEAEEICDRIAIMDKGKILTQGTKEELKKSISLGERSRIRVYHLTSEHLNQIRLIPGIFYVSYDQGILTVKSKKGRNNLIHILQYFQKNEIALGEIISELPTLEDVFWEITGKTFYR